MWAGGGVTSPKATGGAGKSSRQQRGSPSDPQAQPGCFCPCFQNWSQAEEDALTSGSRWNGGLAPRPVPLLSSPEARHIFRFSGPLLRTAAARSGKACGSAGPSPRGHPAVSLPCPGEAGNPRGPPWPCPGGTLWPRPPGHGRCCRTRRRQSHPRAARRNPEACSLHRSFQTGHRGARAPRHLLTLAGRPVSELGRAGPGEALRVERGRRLHRRDPRARRPRARSRILSRHCGRLYRTGLPPPRPQPGAQTEHGTLQLLLEIETIPSSPFPRPGLPEMTLWAQRRPATAGWSPSLPTPLHSRITRPSGPSEPVADTPGQEGSERNGNAHWPRRVSLTGSGKTSQRVSKADLLSKHTEAERPAGDLTGGRRDHQVAAWPQARCHASLGRPSLTSKNKSWCRGTLG